LHAPPEGGPAPPTVPRTYRVGTASWTDPTLVAAPDFYPPGARSAEARLRFYASRFDAVEIDSTYYALPAERNAHLWAARTPPGFVFHVKAFGLLTTHAVETRRLPVAVRELLPAAARAADRLTDPPPAVRDLAFQMFGAALQPLRRAGKLGCLLFQFPPWFQPRRTSWDHLLACAERLPGDRLAIEFRHRSWVAGPQRDETLAFLRRHGFVYVDVDEPDTPTSVPMLGAATGAVAYVRCHGRNRTAWTARGLTAAERFKYRYGDAELRTLAAALRRLDEAQVVHVIFNNCHGTDAVSNAATMRALLAAQDCP
jgi:uncharacterized protein YecE (DUF72 family)